MHSYILECILYNIILILKKAYIGEWPCASLDLEMDKSEGWPDKKNVPVTINPKCQ